MPPLKVQNVPGHIPGSPIIHPWSGPTSAVDGQLYDRQTIRVADVEYEMVLPSGTRVALEISGEFFEADLINDMLEHLRPDDTLWDVGASTGTHAIPAALKLGGTGRVYAFEPDPLQAELLTRNYDLNAQSHELISPLRVVGVPLWSSDMPLAFHTSGLTGKAPRVTAVGQSANTPYATFSQSIVMQARTIQSLIQHDKFAKPDVIKIDVEGFGLHILHGMAANRPRHVYIEVHPLYNSTEIDCVQYLLGIGYSVGSYEQRGRQALYRLDLNAYLCRRTGGFTLPEFTSAHRT